MCCHQAIRPSCPSLVLTAVFVCDMQMYPFFFFFLFFGWRLTQGVGKGVCLLWLWNEPPYVKASAVVLASVLFTVTLSHLIWMMLIASKWFCFGAQSSAPTPAALHVCLKGNLVTHHPNDDLLPILQPIISTCTYCIFNISSLVCLIQHKLFLSKQLLMSLIAANFRSKRVSLPIIWRKPSSCFSTPATQALICSRCTSLM